MGRVPTRLGYDIIFGYDAGVRPCEAKRPKVDEGVSASATSKLFRPVGRDLRMTALGLSFVVYGVPFLGGLPPLPLGLLLLMGLQESPLELWWLYVAAALLQAIAFGAWRLCFAARPTWLQASAATAAVLTTLLPLATGVHVGTPTRERIADQRPPELGDWPVACSLPGYRIAQHNAPVALAAGQFWLVRDERYYFWHAGQRAPAPADWIPEGARLAEGGADGRALYFHNGGLHVSTPAQHWSLDLRPALPRFLAGAKLSLDGSAVAWIADTQPDVVESPWELTVQSLGAARATTTLIALPSEDSPPLRLLAYDEDNALAFLEIDYNKRLVVGRYGQVVSGPMLPDGCRSRISGDFSRHLTGWVFFGGRGQTCDFRWQWEGPQARFDLSRYVGGLKSMHVGVGSAAFNADRRLGAVVTYLPLGHHAYVHESLFVFREPSGREVFRKHLPLDRRFESPGDVQVLFLGNGLLAHADREGVRIYEAPEFAGP